MILQIDNGSITLSILEMRIDLFDNTQRSKDEG